MTVLPGLDMSTGSLGLGLAAGVRVALAAKLDGRDFTTFVMVGDGECNEGIVWESAHVPERYGLDNLVVILDPGACRCSSARTRPALAHHRCSPGVAFLCSADASYSTGAMLFVDGGVLLTAHT